MYLDLMDDDLELGGSLHPGVHQLHGAVKVLHVLPVHLQEGSQLLQDVPDPRVQVPGAGDTGVRTEQDRGGGVCV